jgi:hypothetical protein
MRQLLAYFIYWNLECGISRNLHGIYGPFLLFFEKIMIQIRYKNTKFNLCSSRVKVKTLVVDQELQQC